MKRSLTEEEIEFIIDFIKPNEYIPEDIAIIDAENHKENFRKQLTEIEIYPEMIPELKKQLNEKYIRSIISPGESVGILCAQSIGERQTQTTLNTFHKAGQSETTMTTGVPRFRELLNATKNPKNVNIKIYFNTMNDTLENLDSIVCNSIAGTSMKDISVYMKVVLNKEDEPWYDSFRFLYGNEFDNYPHCISIEFHKEKIYRKQLTMQYIANKINSEWSDIVCVYSSDEICRMDIFMNTENIILPENRVLFVSEENKEYVFLEECVLKDWLRNYRICGIDAITETFYTKENEEWIVETNGFVSSKISSKYSSYREVLSLDIVDSARTISNNAWDIYKILGIEAARTFLIEEFTRIMDDINPVHAILLVERMTFLGTISSINRTTMNKDASGPLGKITFEQTMDNITDAAAKGQTDNTKGVSAAIMCAKMIDMGTGSFDVEIDLNNLPEIIEEEKKEVAYYA